VPHTAGSRRARRTCCPLEYFHVVFTLPAALSAIAWYNKTVLYGLLFDLAADTLRTIAADPRHLGAQIGATIRQHTELCTPLKRLHSAYMEPEKQKAQSRTGLSA
jgi:hypothetical protein